MTEPSDSGTPDISLAEQLAATQAELAEMQFTFDLRWKADMRAIKDWQEVTGRKQTWPDHADLCLTLMMALDAANTVNERAEAELAELRTAGREPVGIVNFAVSAELDLPIGMKLYAGPAVSAAVPDGWIAVSERKPARNQMVFTWSGTAMGGFAEIADEWRDEHHLDSVTHWMPCEKPTAPKAGA